MRRPGPSSVRDAVCICASWAPSSTGKGGAEGCPFESRETLRCGQRAIDVCWETLRSAPRTIDVCRKTPVAVPRRSFGRREIPLAVPRLGFRRRENPPGVPSRGFRCLEMPPGVPSRNWECREKPRGVPPRPFRCREIWLSVPASIALIATAGYTRRVFSARWRLCWYISRGFSASEVLTLHTRQQRSVCNSPGWYARRFFSA